MNKDSDYYEAKADKDKLRYDLIEMTFLPKLSIPKVDIKEMTTLPDLITFAIGYFGYYNLLKELARIYTFGVEKYGEYTWKTVPNGLQRYKSALLRHWYEFLSGKHINHDDGDLLHLAQAVWNAIAILYLQNKEK